MGGVAVLVLPWVTIGSSCSCSAEVFMGPLSSCKEMEAHDLGNYFETFPSWQQSTVCFVVPKVQAAKFY